MDNNNPLPDALPSLCEFARVPSKVTAVMPEEERREIYTRWIALNRIRLEEVLCYSAKPLPKVVFDSLMEYLYENILVVLPELETIEISFDAWSNDLEDLVLTSYAWSQVIDPAVKLVKEHGLTLVQGNDLIN